ncbi:DNA-binding transcriptional LysR family regulator [Primorskyibacter sedentarius]|uniref:DNA-binding transcriptional LysR family regulator n=1 Tax=Primorskyibacter sedentarius TaxID=745311 RepID=A0A4R3J7D0_9RHOB|nr:LysR family transcriptional regulator [Primorskyibacter sedentarius]TCS61829.1 DNA-binding transcriptional LysR family regulator [Primorskyibacter sedentarius]
MIDQLRTMAIFQTVAELGSFRQAAKKLSLSPSVISHHISKLEEDLGTPLLYRSTRRMSLTDAGVALLAASQRMTAAAIDGLSAVQRRASHPTGTLTIAASTPFSHSPYVETFARFAQSYPDVHLSIQLEDRAIPLEGSNIDVAIRGRAGDLDDSSYKARKLGNVKFSVFAAPSYVQGRPTPQSMNDLAEWDWIQSLPVPWSAFATLADGTDPDRVPKTVVTCCNFTMARKFVDEGLGFMIETNPLVADDFRSGRLVHVLPHVKLRPIDVYAIYPTNSPQDGLAHLFIDFMMDQIWATEYGFGLR